MPSAPVDATIPPFDVRHRSNGSGMQEVNPCWPGVALLWLFGRYLADGSVSHGKGTKAPAGEVNKVWWSIGHGKYDTARAMFTAAGLSPTESRAGDRCINFMVGRAPLARWMRDHGGRGAAHKRLPGWVFGLPVEQRQAVLDGYLAGDGCVVNGRIKAATVSWELAVGVRVLAASVGVNLSIYDTRTADRSWWQLVSRDSDMNHLVRSVTPAPGATVYNLSVADDESYVADGLVVHNCQDFAPLELALVRSWGKSMERIVLAGDDDQCQPGWDRVLTQDGYVRLDKLDPEQHRVVALDVRGGRSMRRTAGRHGEPGFPIKVARRPYDGPMVEVAVDGVSEPSTFTPHHRFAARWVDRPGTAVYLMRKGEHWRVGTSAMFRSVGKSRGEVIYGVGHRARIERAEEAWVLSVHPTGAEARLEEARVSAAYGITQVVFKAPTSGNLLSYTQQQIDAHHDTVAPYARAIDALNDHGRQLEHPSWRRDGKHRGRHTILKVEACNLLPGWMALPVDVGDEQPEWRDFTTTGARHTGDVYSLDVEQHHTYVTNGGLITRNSIYGFRGALPDAFLNPPIPDADKIVLSQSWRIPASVHRAAEHWIRQVGTREEKRYDPRAEEGLVRSIGDHYQQPQRMVDQIERSLDTVDVDNHGVEHPATVMVLASCAYMLDGVKHELRARGLPFHNPYRLKRGDWNPLRGNGNGVSSRERLLAYLALDDNPVTGFGEDARLWTGDDVRKWAHVVKKQGVFKRGAAAALDALGAGEVPWETLAGLFADDVELEQAVTPDLGWFDRNLLAASRAPMSYPLQVAAKRGARALVEAPRITLGTIHSVKGGQSSVVFLIPDLSSRGSDEWRKRGAPQDGVRRQVYVGMTRARRELVVCAPATTKFVSPEQIVAGARRDAS